MIVLLSLGSNIDPGRNLPAAVARLAGVGEVLRVSSVYVSPPQAGAGGPDFWNAGVILRTDLDRAGLKQGLRELEGSLGRVRPAPLSAPRTIDIDIVLIDGADPHADTLRYAHVAVPLAELDPGLRHPATGETLADVARRLDNGSVTRLDVTL